MGGTLPILARHFIKKLPNAGSQSGLVYGLNTMGAAFGSLLSGYFLLHHLGVNKTNILAGLVNLAIGLLAWIISTRMVRLSTNHTEKGNSKNHTITPEPAGGSLTLVMVCFGISGFVSIAYEIIWLRYILLYFRDTSFLYSGIISTFIFGLATGCFLFGRVANRVRHPLAFFGFLQLGIGVTTILAMYIPIPWHHAIVQAGEKNPSNILLVLFLLLITPTVLMGATFPIVVRIITTEIKTVGDQIGKAYAVNTLGAIMGSVAAGFFFFIFLGMQKALYILFALNMLTATLLILKEERGTLKRWAAVPFAFCCLFPIANELYFKCRIPDHIVQRISNGDDVLEISEGLTGTSWATISRRFGVVSLLDNRTIISKSDSSSFVIQGAIPQLLTPQIPQRVLGLCFGGGLSYYATRLFRETRQIDLVDISKHNMDLALKHIPQNRDFQLDPKARFIVDDAYNYVKYNTLSYDLIIMDPTPPVFSYRCAALYTKEFYTNIRERLTRNGYFSQVVPLQHMSDEETVNVMKTFSSVFDHCLLWWNGFEPVMIGALQEFDLNINSINRRINRPAIRECLDTFSKSADYTRLSHFISGLLLTTGDFKKTSDNGTIYTNDMNRLELSSLRNINIDNITRIHQSLSSWAGAVDLFSGADLKKYVPKLTARREFLMGILYRMYPNSAKPEADRKHGST
jgi:spermidine synthase